jgi:hypothetical protein
MNFSDEDEFENQPNCKHKKLQCSCGRYFLYEDIFMAGQENCECKGDLPLCKHYKAGLKDGQESEKKETGIAEFNYKAWRKKAEQARQEAFAEVKKEIIEFKKQYKNYSYEEGLIDRLLEALKKKK